MTVRISHLFCRVLATNADMTKLWSYSVCLHCKFYEENNWSQTVSYLVPTQHCKSDVINKQTVGYLQYEYARTLYL